MEKVVLCKSLEARDIIIDDNVDKEEQKRISFANTTKPIIKNIMLKMKHLEMLKKKKCDFIKNNYKRQKSYFQV